MLYIYTAISDHALPLATHPLLPFLTTLRMLVNIPRRVIDAQINHNKI
jgi:hypothetical protein